MEEGRQPYRFPGTWFWVILFGVLVTLLPSRGEVLSASVGEDVSGNPTISSEEVCRFQKEISFFNGEKEEDISKSFSFSACDDVALAALKKKNEGENPLTNTVKELADGYPLVAMADAIARYPTDVAGLIVGIAKKESDWGKHTPKLAAGDECYNFWGYRGPGSRGLTPDGYGCFATPEEGATVIGDRLMTLVEERNGSQPAKMVVWKCGSSCSWDNPEHVEKWISDVDSYYQKFVQ